MGYFFVVPRKTDGTLFLQLQAYKTASGGSNFRCGIAKSIPGSTQTVSLGQQKSSPQYIFENQINILLREDQI